MDKDHKKVEAGYKGGIAPKHKFKFTWEEVETYTSTPKSDLIKLTRKWKIKPTDNLLSFMTFMHKVLELQQK